MFRKTRKYVIGVLALLIAIALAMIFFHLLYKFMTAPDPEKEKDFLHVTSLSGWIPYWDSVNAVAEMNRYPINTDEIVSFAVIFDHQDDALLILDSMDEMTRDLRRLVSKEQSLFLSFTNDVRQSDASYLNKDVDILRRFLATDETIDDHVQNLIDVAELYEVDGIEIDYEAIRKDTELWARFCVFVRQLYEQCIQHDIKLRVVLGWDSVDYADFPPGPDYVIMCYNLYGPHSSAGPKANFDFLKKTFEKNKKLPGKVVMAFANGGFDWSSDGTVSAVTQKEAEALMAQYHVTPTRDKNSGALYYSYTDDVGLTHEVWYADAYTIDYWIYLGTLSEYSDFAIWRFGGNQKDALPSFLWQP